MNRQRIESKFYGTCLAFQKMDIRKISRVNYLIEQNNTGTPAKLAAKLEISERTLYLILDFMKSELGAPIKYNRIQRTYYYAKEGKLLLAWIHTPKPEN